MRFLLAFSLALFVQAQDPWADFLERRQGREPRGTIFAMGR